MGCTTEGIVFRIPKWATGISILHSVKTDSETQKHSIQGHRLCSPQGLISRRMNLISRNNYVSRCKTTNKCVKVVVGLYILGCIPRQLTTLDES
jgi:hypothetical protein